MWDIPWSQLVQWHHFYELSPWDKDRDNLQAVVVGTAIINEIKSVRREFGSKSVKFIKVDDLLLKFDRKGGGKQDEKRTIEQQKRALGQQFHQMVREMKRDLVDGKDGGRAKSKRK